MPGPVLRKPLGIRKNEAAAMKRWAQCNVNHVRQIVSTRA